MTSRTSPPVATAPDAEPADLTPEAQADADGQPSTPASKLPRKPGESAGAKTADQPGYKNGAKNGHTKAPGAAPPGTRRSMGKR